MMRNLENKIALVTGSSRGIGKATALRLAKEGAFVVVHGKNYDAADLVVHEIVKFGGEAVAIGADLSKLTGVENLFEQLDLILKKKSKIGFDILVNNAGVGLICSLEETTEEQIDMLLSINVKAPFFVVQKSLSRMNSGGRIINISSIVTRMAMPAVGAYSMTKGAIHTMTLWLAKQLGAKQITVNSVSPGIVDTDMNADGLANPQARQYMEGLSAFGRVGAPSDIADTIAFLASDDARWVSGQNIEVSGGSFLG